MGKKSKLRTTGSGGFGQGGTECTKVRIKVVDVGRSGRPEYVEFQQEEFKQVRSTVVAVLTRNFMPTSSAFVETILEASLACHYWRSNLNFEGAVEQVVKDIQRSMGRGY
ncbi:hypothetical protein [Floridanema aerugineum]|uniref:Uncharacterized protein n=1 Tax=Floridaenema aerugineum BLCC-F46 TaxID=3153654 RepID=A0ABV4XFZ4_9CYAN